MDWVHRERREHRVNRFLKVLRVVLLFFVRELVATEEKNAVFLQDRNQFLFPNPILVIHHPTHPRRNSCELFAGTHSVRTRGADVTLALLFQTSDPYLKEFIEIGG